MNTTFVTGYYSLTPITYQNGRLLKEKVRIEILLTPILSWMMELILPMLM